MEEIQLKNIHGLREHLVQAYLDCFNSNISEVNKEIINLYEGALLEAVVIYCRGDKDKIQQLFVINGFNLHMRLLKHFSTTGTEQIFTNKKKTNKKLKINGDK